MYEHFGRLLHCCLTRILEANNLLSNVQAEFCPNLAAHDSLLNFQNDLEHNRKTENYALAVFLDVQKVVDSVSVNRRIAGLSFLGLKGRILRFL